MRSYNRFDIGQEIESTIEGEKDFVQLYNLSCGGCMIETRNSAAIVGAEATVVLGDMGRYHGKIAWRIDNNAGIKFDAPLHEGVIEYFGIPASDETFDEEHPQDRYGLPI